MQILSPLELFEKQPISEEIFQFVRNSRQDIIEILKGKSEKIAIILGPCSIHNVEEALDLAKKILTLSQKCPHLYLVMRVFFEKPRSLKGWTGLVYDPRLDETFDINLGLISAVKLLNELLKLKIPCCMEFLDPFLTPYFKDLICWATIGARTSSSQIHRQIASILSCPVGFKNSVFGDIEGAIFGILAAKEKHTFLNLNNEGKISVVKSLGNPFPHIILRGSNTDTNYDSFSVEITRKKLAGFHLPESVIIDCAHGNSHKNHKNQIPVFKNVIEQILEGNNAIKGLMLECNLFEGNQPISKNLKFGISITDSCLGWEDTEQLLLWANESIKGQKQLNPSIKDAAKIQ